MADRTDMPRVEANINLLGEAAQVVEQGACGVGLYRTEFLFLARRTMPTEEEQVGVYRKLLEMLDGRPASIRTFDLRPDKLAHFAHWNASAASPYDWRRVLESPPLQKLFKEQVRAILRAAVAGPARLLVPLVLRSEQLAFVVETIGEARSELRGEALDFSENVPLGVMIEVAAATAMIDTWAGDVDFFSLGTNDLMASALGLDRDDPVGSTPDDLLHPGLLRILQAAIGAAHQAGRRITVCGEMATDPQAAVALAAMGVDSLSVAVHQLANVCSVFRGHSAESFAELAPQLLKLRSAQQARSLLRTWTDQ
jgi:phosphoenolpyruvate-protein kinase (PTS system EI component)